MCSIPDENHQIQIHKRTIIPMQSRKQTLDNDTLRISCVVPVYNEAKNIQAFLDTLDQNLSKHSSHREIIVIDDGSQDLTVRKTMAVINQYPIKLIKLSRNFGKENALTAGLERANGDVVLLIDADFQHPVKLINTFLEKWVDGYDMIYGVRQSRTLSD